MQLSGGRQGSSVMTTSGVGVGIGMGGGRSGGWKVFNLAWAPEDTWLPQTVSSVPGSGGGL